MRQLVYKFAILIVLIMGSHSHAGLVWSWHFSSPDIELDPYTITFLDVVISNDISSDDSIIDAVINLDSSWGGDNAGRVFDEAGDLIFMPVRKSIYAPGTVIQPGQSVSFRAVDLLPAGYLFGTPNYTSEPIFVDPLLTVISQNQPQLHLGTSVSGLTIAVVPLQSSALLFLSALIPFFVKKIGAFKFPVTRLKICSRKY